MLPPGIGFPMQHPARHASDCQPTKSNSPPPPPYRASRCGQWPPHRQGHIPSQPVRGTSFPMAPNPIGHLRIIRLGRGNVNRLDSRICEFFGKGALSRPSTSQYQGGGRHIGIMPCLVDTPELVYICPGCKDRRNCSTLAASRNRATVWKEFAISWIGGSRCATTGSYVFPRLKLGRLYCERPPATLGKPGHP